MLGYTRVSTAEQASSGLGLAAQRALIEQEAMRRRWNLVDVITDPGASGKDLDRPGLMQALQTIANGDADGLVAAKLDRSSRSVVDFGMLVLTLDHVVAAVVIIPPVTGALRFGRR